jgi:hypothetical protein
MARAALASISVIQMKAYLPECAAARDGDKDLVKLPQGS